MIDQSRVWGAGDPSKQNRIVILKENLEVIALGGGRVPPAHCEGGQHEGMADYPIPDAGCLHGSTIFLVMVVFQATVRSILSMDVGCKRLPLFKENSEFHCSTGAVSRHAKEH